MKTLVIYAGQARTIKETWANHIFHVLRKLPDPAIVVSVADDEQAEDMKLLKTALPDIPFFFEKVKQPDRVQEPEPKGLWHAGHGTSTGTQPVLKQLWALSRAWQFASESVKLEDYDLVVRIRSDSAFFRCELPPEIASPSPNFCLLPWFSKWGGQNDRFAFLGTEAARAYFTTYDSRQELYDQWCPIHPETMLDFNLRRSGIRPHPTLKCEFSTIRLDGKVIPAAVTPIDIVDLISSSR